MNFNLLTKLPVFNIANITRKIATVATNSNNTTLVCLNGNQLIYNSAKLKKIAQTSNTTLKCLVDDSFILSKNGLLSLRHKKSGSLKYKTANKYRKYLQNGKSCEKLTRLLKNHSFNKNSSNTSNRQNNLEFELITGNNNYSIKELCHNRESSCSSYYFFAKNSDNCDPCGKKKKDPCAKKKDPCAKKKKDPCTKKEDPCGKIEDPCAKKKDDPCKKKDPCAKKEDPCAKKKEDPCKQKDTCIKKEDPCKKKDPCAKKEDPCAKKKDPCKKRDTCIKKEDPCKQKDPCAKKEDPCAKKKEDPCKKKNICIKKEDPCAKKKDPCAKKEDPCAKKKEDPCAKKREDPCKKKNTCIKKEDPCAKKKDPCAKKEDPCAKKNPCAKKEDPCAKKKEDPCKQKDPCAKKKEDPCKKKDPCAKKEDPCAKKKEDPCKKKDTCTKKEDPCKKKDPCAKKKDPCAKKKEDPCAKKKENPCGKQEDHCAKKDPCAETANKKLDPWGKQCDSSSKDTRMMLSKSTNPPPPWKSTICCKMPFYCPPECPPRKQKVNKYEEDTKILIAREPVLPWNTISCKMTFDLPKIVEDKNDKEILIERQPALPWNTIACKLNFDTPQKVEDPCPLNNTCEKVIDCNLKAEKETVQKDISDIKIIEKYQNDKEVLIEKQPSLPWNTIACKMTFDTPQKVEEPCPLKNACSEIIECNDKEKELEINKYKENKEIIIAREPTLPWNSISCKMTFDTPPPKLLDPCLVETPCLVKNIVEKCDNAVKDKVEKQTLPWNSIPCKITFDSPSKMEDEIASLPWKPICCNMKFDASSDIPLTKLQTCRKNIETCGKKIENCGKEIVDFFTGRNDVTCKAKKEEEEIYEVPTIINNTMPWKTIPLCKMKFCEPPKDDSICDQSITCDPCVKESICEPMFEETCETNELVKSESCINVFLNVKQPNNKNEPLPEVNVYLNIDMNESRNCEIKPPCPDIKTFHVCSEAEEQREMEHRAAVSNKPNELKPNGYCTYNSLEIYPCPEHIKHEIKEPCREVIEVRDPCVKVEQKDPCCVLANIEEPCNVNITPVEDPQKKEVQICRRKQDGCKPECPDKCPKKPVNQCELSIKKETCTIKKENKCTFQKPKPPPSECKRCSRYEARPDPKPVAKPMACVQKRCCKKPPKPIPENCCKPKKPHTVPCPRCPKPKFSDDFSFAQVDQCKLPKKAPPKPTKCSYKPKPAPCIPDPPKPQPEPKPVVKCPEQVHVKRVDCYQVKELPPKDGCRETKSDSHLDVLKKQAKAASEPANCKKSAAIDSSKHRNWPTVSVHPGSEKLYPERCSRHVKSEELTETRSSDEVTRTVLPSLKKKKSSPRFDKKCSENPEDKGLLKGAKGLYKSVCDALLPGKGKGCGGKKNMSSMATNVEKAKSEGSCTLPICDKCHLQNGPTQDGNTKIRYTEQWSFHLENTEEKESTDKSKNIGKLKKERLDNFEKRIISENTLSNTKPKLPM